MRSRTSPNLLATSLLFACALLATRGIAQDTPSSTGLGARLGMPVSGLTFAQRVNDHVVIQGTAGWGLIVAKDSRPAAGPGASVAILVRESFGPHGGGLFFIGPAMAYVRDITMHESPPLFPGQQGDPIDNVRNVYAAGLSIGFGAVSPTHRREFLFTLTPMVDLTRRHSFILGIDLGYCWF